MWPSVTAKAATAYILEEDDEDAFYNSVDEHEFSQWDPEQQEAYLAEQQTIDETLEAIKLQKSTLKEALWRQRQIKFGRNFYPHSRTRVAREMVGRPGETSSASDADLTIKYYQDKCSLKLREKSAQVADESAEIAFSACEFAGQADS